MLKQAILYKDQLASKYLEAMCDDYFIHYNGCSYRNFTIEITNDDWNTIQRVSVDTKGNIIGFITCEFNRDSRNVTGFGLMNFTKKPNLIFAKDIIKFLRELRDNYIANRIEFVAYVGSQAELMYVNFIKKHGGRVIGVKKRSQLLTNGIYANSTIFEILREDMKF